MSDKSPLFVSSMELLAHATELYVLNKPRKFKFVILHLANAVELILKDRLIDKGISIYVAKKAQTITIWDSLDQLALVSVQIPEKPVIELLVDDRNTIQHRFGYPDAQTVFYYIEQVVAFFRRFLADEYALDLAEVLKVHLTESDLALLGLVKEEKAQEVALDRLFSLSPESSLVHAFNDIERRLRKILDIPGPAIGRPVQFPWRHPDFPELLNALAAGGYISHSAVKEFNLLRDMRNKAAHASHFDDKGPIEPWIKALRVAKEYLAGLDRATKEGFTWQRRGNRSSQDNPAAEPTNEQKSDKDIEGEPVDIQGA